MIGFSNFFNLSGLVSRTPWMNIHEMKGGIALYIDITRIERIKIVPAIMVIKILEVTFSHIKNSLRTIVIEFVTGNSPKLKTYTAHIHLLVERMT
jgi:hypothetical protein